MANTKRRQPAHGSPVTSAGQTRRAPGPAAVTPSGHAAGRPWQRLAAGLVIAGLTVSVYAQVGRHGFVALDDPAYVTSNAEVARGLSTPGLAWALTATDTRAGNWHPVTWLSHMLDVELFGMQAGAHHLVSAGLHTVNALLLFGLLIVMTGHTWRAALVAALFALHPLHVESVAWIAERKDVLSTLFWFLSIWAYVRYVRQPGKLRYAAVILLFGMGLMAKPMVVTLPFTLLLLDWWPLGRLGNAWRDGGAPWSSRVRAWVPLLVEKWPLFAMSVFSGVMTVIAQRQAGAVVTLEGIPFFTRAANAVLSYGTYAWQMVWPAGLSCFYPHTDIPSAATAAAAVFLAGVSVVAVRSARRRPHLIVGWLWYLGTLVPVIGLVQVGMQARADRYTYVPLIGLFIAIVWECAERVGARAVPRVAAGAAACAVVASCAVVAHAQVAHWADDASLWKHALDLDADNYYAHYSLGVADLQHGRLERAVPHLERALQLAPWFAEVHDTIGVARARSGQLDAAIAAHLEALRLKPGLVAAGFNLGLAYERRGDLDLAAARYRDAIRRDPQNAAFHAALGHVLARQGHADQAVTAFRAALERNPDFASVHARLGELLLAQGRADEALSHLREAVRLEPGDADLRHALGLCLARTGRFVDAIGHFSEAVRLRPDSDAMRVSLGMALAAGGDASGGAARLREALTLNPDNRDAQAGLSALAKGGAR